MSASTQIKTTQAAPTIHNFGSIVWEQNDEPDHENPTLLHLYTISGFAIIGYWQGFIGEHYTAWAPLYPATNHILH